MSRNLDAAEIEGEAARPGAESAGPEGDSSARRGRPGGELPLVEVLQAGEPGRMVLFLLSPAGNEDTYYRRLQGAMGPSWPMTLLRHSEPHHPTELDLTDERSAAIVASIREQRAASQGPSAPFVLGGYCHSGAQAFATARGLLREGCCGVVLIDSPFPGHPPMFIREPVRVYRTVLRAFRDEFRRNSSTALRWASKSLLWHAVLLLRPVLRPWRDCRPVKGLVKRAQWERSPLGRNRALPVPVLAFLATEIIPSARFPSYMFRAACGDWDLKGGAGSVTVPIACGHPELFFREHLPRVAESLLAWLEALRAAASGTSSGSARPGENTGENTGKIAGETAQPVSHE